MPANQVNSQYKYQNNSFENENNTSKNLPRSNYFERNELDDSKDYFNSEKAEKSQI